MIFYSDIIFPSTLLRYFCMRFESSQRDPGSIQVQLDVKLQSVPSCFRFAPINSRGVKACHAGE